MFLVAVQCYSVYVKHDRAKAIRIKTAIQDRQTLLYHATQTGNSTFIAETSQ